MGCGCYTVTVSAFLFEVVGSKLTWDMDDRVLCLQSITCVLQCYRLPQAPFPGIRVIQRLHATKDWKVLFILGYTLLTNSMEYRPS
jgi:hypothetical protein